MKVIVDTCIWSLAFRRTGHGEDLYIKELRELIKEFMVQMIGPVRQEILSGVKSAKQFKKLRDQLRAFPDIDLGSQDYERAAEFYNINRRKGIQGSNTDFLICSLAVGHNMPIFTTDEDFKLFQKNIPFTFHSPRKFK